MQLLKCCKISTVLAACALLSGFPRAFAEDLQVGKVCPVNADNENLGVIVVSRPWYHASRIEAAYQAMDNATGIGVEIHFFASERGDTRFQNSASCDRYRFLQIRNTNARLHAGESPLQVDIPHSISTPFYDTEPLEHGRGTHSAPPDDNDKPWNGQPGRSSTVSIYDTPYVSDGYGIDGQDIRVRFETCAVCERDQLPDQVLSCVSWGYVRDYMGGNTGWAEPEALPMQCLVRPTRQLITAIQNTTNISYDYGRDWH